MQNSVGSKFDKNQSRLKPEDTIAKKGRLPDETLVYLFHTGVTAYKIAKQFGMTQQAIIKRLDRLGLWVKKHQGNQFVKKGNS